MPQGPRVAVIGLDCGTPQLLFRDLADEIPNIRKLMDSGLHGDLASITPPITVPAWACAMSGRTPGQLGIYGFRNRKDTTYDGLSIATSDKVTEPQVWDELGKRGYKSLLIGVPPGFPPKPIEGWRVSCFLTPPSSTSYAAPSELQTEIEEELGGPGQYIFDIPNFREQGYEFVLDQLFKMTERRFKVARRLLKNKPWDYFMFVEIGVDRLHHVFWQYYDSTHRKYEPGNKFETAFQDYYRMLDREVGSLLELLPDDVITILMSDHGARPMVGGVCFNDWLIREGYLSLSEPVTEQTPIAKAPIDWSRTVAWGDGGYYGRLFLNVKGREPEGIVEPAQYETTRNEMIERLEAMTGPDGEHLGTKVIKPQDVYTEVRGVAPDLIVYFGDLAWRSVGAVAAGQVGGVFTYENDTGPDGANHDRTGVFVMNGLPGQRTGMVEGLNLVDVGPTILSLYDIDAPAGAVGRSFL
ncbi:MAG TPA: alkaline phosphatase family protein [Actinomycetota bacterium]|nr:alkaline phosphatase family protein [Actinomycetota bacterium]